jgi:hypothetical protein
MSIEIEQVFEGAYFIQEGERVRIHSDDFPRIPSIVNTFEPILISHAELSMLRFSLVNATTGVMARDTLSLKPGLGGKWFLIIEDVLTPCYVYYVHQLQRLYFSLFEEHLRYANDPITPTGKPPINYEYKPSSRVVRVKIPKGDPRYGDPRTKLDNKGIAWKPMIQDWPDDPYYVTYDMRLLVRSKVAGYAIWEIVHHISFFSFGGKNWGLKLAAGKYITPAETEAAGKWLHQHLLVSNVKQ